MPVWLEFVLTFLVGAIGGLTCVLFMLKRVMAKMFSRGGGQGPINLSTIAPTLPPEQLAQLAALMGQSNE